MEPIIKFHNAIKETVAIFLSIVFILLGYPLFFLILLPCWIYKQIAVKLAQKDPKVGNILEGMDDLLTGPDPYIDPLIVLIPYFTLADKLDVSTVVKVLKEKVIEPNLYPELSQRIVQKYGYHFWYSIDNFKLEDHVRNLQPECSNMPITRTQLRELVTNKLGKLPFDSTKSPWEILVVSIMTDDRDPEVKSVFLLRMNHCLMDGYSMINFLQKVALKPWNFQYGEKPELGKKGEKKLLKIYKFLKLFFSGPYYLLKTALFSNDSHKFIQNVCKPNFDEVYNSQCSPSISENRLKHIKNAYGVSMSALITTLIGKATWECMKNSGITVPKTIHGLLSYPIPGHKDVLTNHCTLVKIPVTVNEDDPKKTLMLMEKEFQSLRNSVKPLVIFYVFKLAAFIPLWFRAKSKSISGTTFGLTNFPGPTEPSDIFGCKLKQFCLGGKPSRGIPFFHGSLSLSGQFWLSSRSAVCNLPNQADTDALCESVMETLTYLEDGIPENSNFN